jgi:hypothetical protein
VAFRSVTVRAELRLVAADEGGLREPLQVPTQSLVFRFVDGAHKGEGVVAVVSVARGVELAAGTVADARITFPDAPPDEMFSGRRFELWLGSVVGSATVKEIEADTT